MLTNQVTIISSETKTIEICRDKPTVLIGERINPTGSNKFWTGPDTFSWLPLKWEVFLFTGV